MLKRSDFSQVNSTSENSDVFNSLDEIYLVFTKKKIFYTFYRLYAMSHPLKNEVPWLLVFSPTEVKVGAHCHN